MIFWEKGELLPFGEMSGFLEASELCLELWSFAFIILPSGTRAGGCGASPEGTKAMASLPGGLESSFPSSSSQALAHCGLSGLWMWPCVKAADASFKSCRLLPEGRFQVTGPG